MKNKLFAGLLALAITVIGGLEFSLTAKAETTNSTNQTKIVSATTPGGIMTTNGDPDPWH